MQVSAQYWINNKNRDDVNISTVYRRLSISQYCNNNQGLFSSVHIQPVHILLQFSVSFHNDNGNITETDLMLL